MVVKRFNCPVKVIDATNHLEGTRHLEAQAQSTKAAI
jgi:hypothetical protein